MAHLVARLAGSVVRNIFILLISVICCRCRHRVLRALGLDKASASSSNGGKPLEGVYVQSNSSSSFGHWENWEPALPAPKNKVLAAKAQQAKQQQEPQEPEPDYFSDMAMAPKVTKPPLIVKKSREAVRPDSSKLALKEDHFPQLSSELTEWEDPSTNKNAAEGWQTVDVLSGPQENHHQQQQQHYQYSNQNRQPSRPKRPR